MFDPFMTLTLPIIQHFNIQIIIFNTNSFANKIIDVRVSEGMFFSDIIAKIKK